MSGVTETNQTRQKLKPEQNIGLLFRYEKTILKTLVTAKQLINGNLSYQKKL